MRTIEYLIPMVLALAGYAATASWGHQAPPLSPWLFAAQVHGLITGRVPWRTRALGMLAMAAVMGGLGVYDEGNCQGCHCGWQGVGMGLLAGYALSNLFMRSGGMRRLNNLPALVKWGLFAGCGYMVWLQQVTERQCAWTSTAVMVYFVVSAWRADATGSGPEYGTSIGR